MKISVDFFTGTSISKEDIKVFKQRENNRRWRIAHPEQKHEKDSNYWKAHSKQEYARARRWKLANPEHSLKYQRKHAYGISDSGWTTLFEKQQRQCALCHKPFKSKREAHTDHNHTTGKVRGLLCRDCNLMLGYAHDNPALLLVAYQYLTSEK